MKSWKEAIKKDFWVVMLDIVAVNVSYLLALLIRFYVNFNLRPVAAERYFPAWEHFAPFYTILCIFVFIAFRLYGGMWRYAGINDMNRIIIATLVTSVINIAGSCLFFTRMPITYYILGTILQFVFVVAIRFSYRAILAERKKIKSRSKIKQNCIIIGTGENGRRVLKHIEEEDSYKPIAVIGDGSRAMDGVPVITFEEIEWKSIDAVFISDPLLPMDQRQFIKKQCEKLDIEIHDFTGYYANLGGRLPVTELLSIISGPVIIEINSVERAFSSGAEALETLTKKYNVRKIEGRIKVKLVEQKELNKQEILAQACASMTEE